MGGGRRGAQGSRSPTREPVALIHTVPGIARIAAVRSMADRCLAVIPPVLVGPVVAIPVPRATDAISNTATLRVVSLRLGRARGADSDHAGEAERECCQQDHSHDGVLSIDEFRQ